MAAREVLSHDAANRELALLNNRCTSAWTITQNKLQKKFEFNNFVTAFGFMTQTALIAERMNHHPEWRNVYRMVEVALITHDAGGITELDFKLAHAMEEIARSK